MLPHDPLTVGLRVGIAKSTPEVSGRLCDNLPMPQDAVTVSGFARMIRESSPLLLRFLAGFDESNRARQAPNLPNHSIWILGHCAFTMARLAELIGGPAPREADFEPGEWTRAMADRAVTRFLIEEIAKDSVPSGDASRYPSLARGVEIFEHAAADLAAAIDSATAERLAETVPWVGTQQPLASLVIRIAVHNGMHAGQLTDLRRALGFQRVLPMNPPKVAVSQAR